MSRLSFLRQREKSLGSNLTGLFHKRQERFLASLEKALSVIGSDVYIQQMFDDENSAIYIPDRICEVVRTVVTDDREAFLQRLMTRLNALQACFGSERIEKIEDIGVRFIDASMSESRQDSEMRRCVGLLRGELASLEAELVVKYGGGSDYVGSIDAKARELQELSVELTAQMKALESEMRQCFVDVKAQVLQEFPVENLRQLCEKRVAALKTKLRGCVQVIKEQANELDTLKAEIKKLKKEDKASDGGQVALERLEQELRELRADGEIKAIALERVNAHNQVLAKENSEKEGQLTELRMVVADLTDKVAALKNINGERMRALKDEKRKRDTLRDVVTEHRVEIKALKQGLRDHDRQFREFQLSLDDPTDGKDQKIVELSEENVKLQRQVKYYEGAMEAMKRKESELEEGSQRQDDIIGDLKEELAQCKSELAKQKRVFDAQIAEKDDEIWKLSKQKAKAEGDLDDVEAELQKLKRVTQAQLREKDEEMTRMQSASQDAYEDLTAQQSEMANASRETIAKLEQKIEKLRRVTEEQSQTIDALDQENTELREASQSIIKEDGEREAQLIADNENLAAENRKLRAKLETLNEKLASTSDLLQRSKAAHESSEVHARKLHEELVDALRKSDSKDSQQQMQQKLASLEETVKGLQDRSFTDSKRRVEKLNAKLTSASELNEKLTLRIQSDQDRIEELEAEVSDRGYRIRKLEKEISRLRNLKRSETDGAKDTVPWPSPRGQELPDQDAQKQLSKYEEKLEEQANELSDLSRQNKRLTRELDRARMELKHQEDTSATIELKRLQEIARKLTRLCEVQSFGDVLDAVEEMKKAASNETAMIAKLRQITDRDDPVAAVRQHKRDSEDLHRLQQALMPNAPRAPVDNLIADIAKQSQGKDEMNSRERSLLHILGIESPQNIVKAVTSLQTKCDSQHELLDSLSRTLKVDSLADLARKTEQLASEKRELEKKLVTILEVKTPNDALTALSALKHELARSQEINAKLCKMLDVQKEAEITDIVGQLIRENDDLADREEQIMVTLSIENPDDILKAIDEQQLELSRYTKVLEALITMLGCSKDIEVVEEVSHLLQATQQQQREAAEIVRSLGAESPRQTSQQITHLRECADVAHELCHILNIGHPDGLPSAVASLIAANQRFQALNKLFVPDLANTSLHDKICRVIDRNDMLLAERQELADLLKSDNLVEAINRIVSDMESASRVLSRVLSVFSTAPVKLVLPMSESNEERLIDVVTDFKAKADQSQAQLDAIVSRAKADGFRGTLAMDAVDYIAAHCADAERQRAHENLMEVRASSAKERTLADRQRERNRKRIGDLRSAIAESASREEELISTLEQERQKVRELEQERSRQSELHKRNQ